MYFLCFTVFWVVSIFGHLQSGSNDHVLDFVRISEVFLISVMYVAILITEQYMYKPCGQVLISLHHQLTDIIRDFLVGSSRHQKILKEWFNKEVVLTFSRLIFRTTALMIVWVSIAYTKCIHILEVLPLGWNYIGMALLLMPFMALSFMATKVCFCIHAMDLGFQMLNKQIQINVDELNNNETTLMQETQQSGELQLNVCSNEINMVLLELNAMSPSQRLRPSLTTQRHRLLLHRKQTLTWELLQSIIIIRAKHDALHLLTRDFFRRWALYLLLFFTMQFTLLVMEAFFLFSNVSLSIHSGSAVDVQYALLNLRACVMVAIELTWTTGACSSLMCNIQRISITLNSLVLHGMDTTLAQTIEAWTIKLFGQPNVVQVFQLFDINNRLLASVSHRPASPGMKCRRVVIVRLHAVHSPHGH